jgi:drug/metabolite transporter (DMT)-like permease
VPRRLTLILCLSSLALLWGLAFVAIKQTLTELSPTTLTVIRFVIADLTLVLLMIGLPAARPTFPREQRWRLIVLALTGVPLYHLPLNWGETRTTAQVASLIVATAPVLLALGAVWLLKEKMTWTRVVGIALSFTGVIVLTLGTPQSDGHRITLTGVLAVAVAPIAWTVYTLVAKPLMRFTQPLRLTSTTILLGSVTLLPLISQETFSELSDASLATWLWLILLGVGSSVAGYLLFVWLIQHVDASQSGVVLYLVPVVGVLASAWILGEPLGWAVAVAAVLVLVGLSLTQRTPPTVPAPEA